MTHNPLHQGPINPFVPEKSEAQLQCEANGGKWDGKKCIMPEKKKATTPETFRGEKGQLAGITLPDGRTFLGLNPADVRAIAEMERLKAEQPAGTAPVGTAALAAREQARKIALAKSVGTIDFELASQLEEQGLNVREFLAAGTQQAVESAATFGITAGITGAAIGGIATAPAGGVGAVPAGGVAALAGAGAGAVVGFFKGITSNIKSQRQDLVTVKTKELKQRKTAIQNYISAANTNPAAADEYVAAMNIEKSLIRKDYNTLVKRGNEDLEFWGSDATKQIAEYDVYFESVEPSLELRMEQAVLKPEPARAFLTIGEEE